MTEMDSPISILLEGAIEGFRARFDREPTMAAAAPGRVNLIGEHTDYNDGYVLPIAIDQWSVVVGDCVADDGAAGLSTWVSLDLGEEVEVDASKSFTPIKGRHWINYPMGVVEEFRQHQIELPGIDFVLTSSIPIGAGLSSSAALTVSLATLLEQSVGAELDPLKKARWCQRAEHEFPKVPCGLMDPMISALAVEGHAFLIDCQSMETKRVGMPSDEDAVLLVVNSNVRHHLALSEYAVRKEECARAVQAIQQDWRAEISSLREVTNADLKAIRDVIDPVLFKRTMHVVTENLRTLEAVEALSSGDLCRFGKYMFASHLSLRDDYEVSCAELDNLVELAGEFCEAVSGRDGGVFGARMTGGGFGGCVIVLCQPGAAGAVEEHLITGQRAKFDRSPTIFSTRAVGGVFAVDLSDGS